MLFAGPPKAHFDFSHGYHVTLPANWWNDVVLQATFDGLTNGSTAAVDSSPVGATLTYHGGAHNTTAATVNGIPGEWFTQSSVLQMTNPGDYVTAPDNASYYLNDEFTIEFEILDFLANNAGGFPVQLIGVWDEDDVAKQSWRIVMDPNEWYFQWREDGEFKSWRIGQGLGNYLGQHPSTWVHFEFTKIGRFLAWTGINFAGGLAGNWDMPYNIPPNEGQFAGAVINKIDPPSSPTPLRIGGPASLTAYAGRTMPSSYFMANVRVVRRGLYPTQSMFLTSDLYTQLVLGTGPLLYGGTIKPPLKASDDQFFTGAGDTDIGMRVARNMLTPRVIDVDTFYPPSVQISGGTARTLRPSFFVDKEDFFGRSIFDNQALLGGFFGDFYTGPNYPKIQGGGSLRLHGLNFPWPWVADNGVHCGQSGGAYPQTTPLTLPTGRQTGDLLIAFVQIGGEGADKLSRYFTVDDVPIDDPAGDFFAGFTGNEAGLYFANNWSGRFDGADPDVPGYDGWTFSQWVMPGGLPGLSASGPDSLFAMAWRYVDGNETEPVFKWFGQTDTGLGTTAFNPDTGQFELDPENPDLIPGELTLFPMPAERWAGRVIAVRGAARDGFAINTFNYVTNAATGPYPSSTPSGYQQVMHESHFDIATFLFVVTTDNDQTIPKPVSTPTNYYPPGEFFLTAAFPTPFVTQLKAPYNRVDVDLDFQDNHSEGSVMICHRNASSGQRPHETNPFANNASDFGSGIVGEVYHAGGAGFSRLIEQNLTLPVAGAGYPNWTVWGIAISPRYDGDDEFIP